MVDLIESGVANTFGPIYGFNNSLKFNTFAFGLNGVEHSEEQMQKLKEQVTATLQKIIEKGFENEMIEFALHQIEISLKLPKSR